MVQGLTTTNVACTSLEGRRTGPTSDKTASRPIDFHLGYGGNPADLLGGFFRLLATRGDLGLKAVGPILLQTRLQVGRSIFILGTVRVDLRA